jgi:hypothetical protein
VFEVFAVLLRLFFFYGFPVGHLLFASVLVLQKKSTNRMAKRSQVIPVVEPNEKSKWVACCAVAGNTQTIIVVRTGKIAL